MQLAQINVATAQEPLHSPLLAEFVGALDEVNALADAAAGFVWRLQAADGDATSIRIDPDPLVIVNMSVWESADALWDFVYSSDHLAVMRRRREWFRSRVSPTWRSGGCPTGTRPRWRRAWSAWRCSSATVRRRRRSRSTTPSRRPASGPTAGAARCLLSYRTPAARASSAQAATTICARSPTSTSRRARDRRGGAMRSSGGIVHVSRSARVIAARGLRTCSTTTAPSPATSSAANATAPTATSASGTIA